MGAYVLFINLGKSPYGELGTFYNFRRYGTEATGKYDGRSLQKD